MLSFKPVCTTYNMHMILQYYFPMRRTYHKKSLLVKGVLCELAFESENNNEPSDVDFPDSK